MPTRGVIALALVACCAVALAGAAGTTGAADDAASQPTASLGPDRDSGAAGSATAAWASQDTATGAGEPTVLGQAQPEADATVIRADVAGNGSARWTLEVRTRLRTDDEVAEFETFQERFRANRSEHRESFRERMAGVAETVAADAGRSTTVRDARATTTVERAPQRWGVVRLSVRWDGFAATERSRLRVGDAFGTGFYIGDDTVLRLDLPAGYEVASVEPEPDDRDGTRLAWHGPQDFEDDRPRVVATGDGRLRWLLAGGALLVLLGLAAAAWHRDLHRRALAALGRARPSSGPDPVAGDVRAAPATSTGAAPTEPADAPPLADEDRVERLLRERGGRCRQSEVVEALDWSKSKTSRVLSRMADDGAVEKRRIGRENVVELVDEE